MSIPVKLPEWATSEVEITEPDAGEKVTGWETDTRPPAQYFNWWQNLAYKWLSWIWSGYLESNASLGATAPDFSNGDGDPSKVALLGLGRMGIANAEVVSMALTADGALRGGVRIKVSGASVFVGLNGAVVSSLFTGAFAEQSTAGPITDDLFCAAESSVLPSTAGVIVIAGENAAIQTAVTTDLTSWTARTPAASYTGDFTACAFGANGFHLVGQFGEIQSSSNGTTWTHRDPDAGFDGDFFGLVWAEDLGLYVAVGETLLGDPEIQTSADGTTWEQQTFPVGCGPLRTLTTDGTKLLAADSTGNVIYSNDGITWTLVETLPSVGLTAPKAFNLNGVWYLLGATNGRVLVSADRITWAVVTATNQSLTGIAFNAMVPFGPNEVGASPQRLQIIGPVSSVLRTWGF